MSRKDIDDKKDYIIQKLNEGVPRLELCRELGCKYDTLKKRIDNWGVSHLKNPNPKGRIFINSRVSADAYFDNNKKIGSHKLRLKLIRDGFKQHVCEGCSLTEWKGQPIPLELDHIDGDRYNNALENLRLLCPNCHALTPTNSGKNIGKYGGSGRIRTDT